MSRDIVSKRMLRFAIIGMCNAAITFSILNVSFYKFHQAKITSSIIATSCALVFSFVMNRGFVFGDKTKKAHRQLPAFVIVTISGSLLVLNIVYAIFLRILNGHEYFIIDIVKAVADVSLSSNFVDINLSTVFGAIAAMFWNYNGYKRFVFNGRDGHAVEEAFEHTP